MKESNGIPGKKKRKKKKKKTTKKHLFCHTDYAKAFVYITTNGKFLKKWDTRTPYLSLEKPIWQVRKQQLEPDME